MPSSALLTVSGLVAGYVFLRFLLSFTHDAKEPPALKTAIPFLSPIIGMRKKAKFYIDLRYVQRVRLWFPAWVPSDR
jgi:hypothetical protein